MSRQHISAVWLQNNAIRVVRLHFAIIAVYAVFIVASDAWNLVTSQVTWQRWLVCTTFLMIMTTLSYLARAGQGSATYFRVLIIGTVLADLLLACFVVYSERGMASRGVALYGLSIVSAAALLNRSAIFGAATLATAGYILTATTYFYMHFNEGYKAELYTTLGLYCSLFYVLAGLLWVVLSYSRSPSTSPRAKRSIRA